MIDTRKIEKQARELINRREKLMFYLIVKNGNLIERKIEPVMHPDDAEHIYYTDVRKEYYSDDPIDLNHLDLSKLSVRCSEKLPTFSTENGYIYNKIEELLKSGYQVL